ncbi:MAG TPA: helix-turn-helix domain-containing protein, partial [Pseudorhizobium sp.]|nr:helix-turn-helix domain-containing protein [Pseudorhizobium sp.]
MKPRHQKLTGECQSVSEILARVGDKWTVLVVGLLGAGPMRFSELRRAIDGISQKMLTTTLRTLER